MINCGKCSWQIAHNENAIQQLGVTLTRALSVVWCGQKADLNAREMKCGQREEAMLSKSKGFAIHGCREMMQWFKKKVEEKNKFFLVLKYYNIFVCYWQSFGPESNINDKSLVGGVKPLT